MFFGEPFGGVVPGAQGAVLATLLRTDAPLTGRQIHRLVSDDYSLWAVQEALKILSRLGIVETATIGRAGVHTINETHAAVAPLRAILSPIAVLTDVIRELASPSVDAVILFGSIARGEASRDSDVDLAVIASPSWDRRTNLEDLVRIRLGNHCDVVHLSKSEFGRRARSGDPLTLDILRDGVALYGAKPAVKHGAA